MLFMDWFTMGGLLAVMAIVAALAYVCKTGGCGDTRH